MWGVEKDSAVTSSQKDHSQPVISSIQGAGGCLWDSDGTMYHSNIYYVSLKYVFRRNYVSLNSDGTMYHSINISITIT